MKRAELEAATEELTARYGKGYTTHEIEAIWRRVEWFNEKEFDELLVQIYRRNDGFLPAVRSWMDAAEIVSPRAQNHSPASAPLPRDTRLVPIQWVRDLKAAMAARMNAVAANDPVKMAECDARFAELKRRRT